MLQKTARSAGSSRKLVGAEPEEIGFLFATSEGENIVASALDLQPGDNVVVDELHYNTSFVLYRHLEETRGIALRIVKHRDGRVTADDVRGRWTIGHASCRWRGSPIRTVSGTTCGRSPIWRTPTAPCSTRMRCRRWACFPRRSSGRRRLHDQRDVQMAPRGVRRRAVLHSSRAAREGARRSFGALHVEKELGDHPYEIYRTARKFEYATLPFAEIYQLGAALAYLERVGVGRIERHTVALARELREGWPGLAFACSRRLTTTRRVVSGRLDRNSGPRGEVLDRRQRVQGH
jgi:hypothetical protein